MQFLLIAFLPYRCRYCQVQRETIKPGNAKNIFSGPYYRNCFTTNEFLLPAYYNILYQISFINHYWYSFLLIFSQLKLKQSLFLLVSPICIHNLSISWFWHIRRSYYPFRDRHTKRISCISVCWIYCNLLSYISGKSL